MNQKQAIAVSLGFGALLLATGAAHAGEPGLTLGARVGGYGFRQAPTAESDHTGWTGCRMNGLGVFGERRLSRVFFVEGGLDAYFTDDTGTRFHEHGGAAASAWADEPMDRVSGLLTVAGGAYLLPGHRVSPYVQLGLGLELTHVAVGGVNPVEDDYVFPVAFLGIGGDVRLGTARLGAVFRLHAMGAFDPPEGSGVLDPKAELAAQGQFYAKFEL